MPIGGVDRKGQGLVHLLRHVDLLLVASTFALSVLGALMVYSVTRPNAVLLGVSPHAYLVRQAGFIAVGVVVMLFVASFDYRHYEALGIVAYGCILLALLGVLAGFGHSAKGSQRWFQLGSIQVQPSEFAVLAVLLAVAYAASREERFGGRWLMSALVLSAVPIGLVFLQPDLGTAIVLGVMVFVMLVVAGTKGRMLFLLAALLVAGIFGILNLGVLKTYQKERLTAFLNPGAASADTVYNLRQSEDAIGSGGVWGTGYGKGTQINLAYVPEAQTDFIFAAVGEQLGFVGSATVLGLFTVMLWRILRAIALARDRYGRLIAAGALGAIGFSVFQNAGMTMGIMPITGIPLPFMSYGGSAVVVFYALVGLVLNVEMRRFRVRRGEVT